MESENEELLVGCPNIISYESTKIIIKQMEKNICKIKIGGARGTGFFCKIPFPDKEHNLTVLITANHIINKNILNEENRKIPVKIKEENKKKIINLNNRMKYTNAEYDITIIEIKEEDDINYFLELDDVIMSDLLDNNNKNEDLEGKTLYILHYPGKKLSVSYGIFDKIFEDKKYLFTHKCSALEGSLGSPILNEESNKVIGIHLRGTIDKKYNKGTFLNYAIKEFIEVFNKTENNENTIIDEKEQNKLIKQFNKKYNTKIEKYFTTIELSNKQIGNEGLKILCDIEFKVLNSLYLFKNNISDIQALEKAKFDKLEVLSLSYNNISDISVLNKVNFFNLKELNLGNNNISDISVLEKVIFNKLEKLLLDHNKITNIDILDQTDFENLKELNLNNNRISNINVLENVEFPKLKKLNLEGNLIENIDVLEKVNFKELNDLNLFKNNISDINVFNKYKFFKLKMLNVNSNPLTESKNFLIIDKLKKINGLLFIGNFKDK